MLSTRPGIALGVNAVTTMSVNPGEHPVSVRLPENEEYRPHHPCLFHTATRHRDEAVVGGCRAASSGGEEK